jgi:hypothetical protein
MVRFGLPIIGGTVGTGVIGGAVIGAPTAAIASVGPGSTRSIGVVRESST